MSVAVASCVLRTKIRDGRHEGEVMLANPRRTVFGVFRFEDPSTPSAGS